MAEDDLADLEAPDDRRLHDRLRLIVDVFFDGQDATGVASTKDISAGGFYMKTQASLPVGSVLQVRIRLAENKQVVADAEVVYSDDGNGVGLRFCDLSAENKRLIESELTS